MSIYKPLFREEIHNLQKEQLAAYAVTEPKESRTHKEPDVNKATRSDFQRDRDRIIHSKAFRRLMYKTQVFVNHEGDHYRTRLTHSLEVAQIARGIARSLHVNEDLTEAIALGHDLGHTPFGHAIEDYLNECLKNEKGFLHNEQSVRVVNLLEKKEGLDFGQGLNLTSEVKEGILKHTNSSKEIYKDLEPSKFCHLEGQIVYFADQIAYYSHDLEDGLNSGIFTDLVKNELLSEKDIDNIWEMFGAERKWGISNIINKLVVDLVEGTLENLKTIEPKSPDDVRQHSNMIVGFKTFSNEYKRLRKFVTANIYKSPFTQVMDTKAKRIIDCIYNAYQENPEQLPYEIYVNYKEPEKYPQNEGGYYTTPTRILCDYIASMTDRFAIETYNKLFNPDKKIVSI